MDKKQLENLLLSLRRPAVIIALAAILGIGLNVMLAAKHLMPLIESERAMSKQAQAVDMQRKAIEQRPAPLKIDQAEFDKLLAQVPPTPDISRFLLSLKEIEGRTGITLSNIAFDDETTQNGNGGLPDLAGALISQPAKAGTSPSGNSGAGAKPSASPVPAQPAAKTSGRSGGAAFASSTIHLQLKGTYIQITNFLTQLYQLERIVTISQWQFQATSAPAPHKATPDLSDSAAPEVQMTLVLTIFNDPQYTGKSPGLPPVSAQRPDKRDDPTMTDNTYWQVLQALQANLNK